MYHFDVGRFIYVFSEYDGRMKKGLFVREEAVPGEAGITWLLELLPVQAPRPWSGPGSPSLRTWFQQAFLPSCGCPCARFSFRLLLRSWLLLSLLPWLQPQGPLRVLQERQVQLGW